MKTETIPEEKKQVIRQELNIEKWPLFTTSKFKGKSREFTREMILENGNRIKRKVTIGKTQSGEVGILRIADYKVFSALTKLWEEGNRPLNNDVNFTIHSIAKLLNLQWGHSTYKHLYGALERLKVVPIIWENSFYQKETDTTERLVEYFNILDNLTIFERHAGDQLYFTFSRFRLNSKIINNLLNNYSKPLYLDTILKFKKEISVLLYRHIDLIMADKNCYERKTQELFSDLELSEYKYPSKRKQLLEPALKELEGVELTTGILSQSNLEKTADGKDWKVVFRKSRRRLKLEDKSRKKQDNQEITLVIDLFNNRFPREKGTLQETMIQQLIEQYSVDKVMVHISRIPNNGSVANPAGLLRSSLENNWELAPTQEEIKEQNRQARDEKEKERREKEREEKEKYLKAQKEEERVNNIFLSLTEEEQNNLRQEARRIIVEQHIDNSQGSLSEFLLRDTMIMIKIREILRKKEEAQV